MANYPVRTDQIMFLECSTRIYDELKDRWFLNIGIAKNYDSNKKLFISKLYETYVFSTGDYKCDWLQIKSTNKKYIKLERDLEKTKKDDYSCSINIRNS